MNSLKHIEPLASSILLLISLNILLFYPNIASAEIEAKQDLSVITYRVSGNKEKSFYRKNQTRYLYEGSLNFIEKMSESTEIYGNIFYTMTDDRLIDAQDASLKQMTIGYRSKITDLVMGDNLAYFSDYSLNNALKGLTLKSKIGESSKILLTMGLEAPTWDIFWENRKDDGPAKRLVWGARFETMPLKEDVLILGFNYGNAKDDSAYFTETGTYKEIQVVSSDFKYKLTNKISLKGEIARSFSKAYTNGAINYDENSEAAYKIALEIAEKKFFSSAQYDRADPHFDTTGGFSSQDLETFQTNNNIFLAQNFTLSPYLTISKDNLKNSKATTTKQTNPGINFSWGLPLDIALTGGFDMRKEKTIDDSSDNKTNSATLGISKSFSSITTTINYEKSFMRDNVNPDQERNRDTISLNLSGGLEIRASRIAWNIQENISKEEDIYLNKSDLLLMHSAGINLSLPKDLNINARFALSDNDFYENNNDSDMEECNFSLSKKIKDSLTFFMDYTQRNNRFNDSNNDYAEKKLTLKLSYKL